MSDERWLILSAWWTRGERVVWWKKNSHGYTEDLDEAGRYTKAEADAICSNTNRNLAVIEEDAESYSVQTKSTPVERVPGLRAKLWRLHGEPA